jgi:hypothetical protein
MDTFETNVAKITLGNSKQTNTYVLTLAEKTPHPDCEIFAVVSLPVLNPAALDDCERIAGALTATLQRSFKRSANESTFELALGEINDEMGKLNSLGQQNWTGKISAVVAARKGTTLYVAATGKTSALLIRNGEVSEITESTETKHPLKTFDTFSSGKIKPKDLIVITTTEFFNHLSLDRAKNILENNTLELAAQEILQLLEDNAGPEVAFGTLLIQEMEKGLEDSTTLNTANYGTDNTPFKEKLVKHAKKLLSKDTAIAIWQNLQSAAKKPKISVDKLSKIAEYSGQGMGFLKDKAKTYKNFDYRSPITNFRTASRPKQFFIVSVIVLVIAIATNIAISQHRKSTATKEQAFTSAVSAVESTLNDAESKLVFKDTTGALSLLDNARNKLQSIVAENTSQKDKISSLELALATLQNRILNITPAKITSLGALSGADHLIVLPGALATATGTTIVSYDIASGKIEDGKLKTPVNILNSVSFDSLRTVIFDGQGLRVWTPSSGETGDPFYQNLPKPNYLVALDKYDTNSRVYILDTEKSQVTSFLVTNTTISKPSVSVSNSALSNAYDLAVDGSIYVLTTDGVLKFTAGKAVPYALPTLNPPLNPAGKITTGPNMKNVYILDPSGRIIITDKKGTLVKILADTQLKNAKDFYVDETSSTIYVLNSGSLLKVNMN